MLCTISAKLQVGMSAHFSSQNFYQKNEKKDLTKFEMSQHRWKWSANGT